jgi:hypothetical protein
MKSKIAIIARAFILQLLAFSLLSACGTSGIRYYEPVTRVDKAGHRYQKNELVAAIETDLPGLSELTVGKLSLKFSDKVMQIQEAAFDKKGNYVATLNQSLPAGMYASRAIDAKGRAMKKIIDSSASGVTGAAAMIGGAAVTGGVTSWIPR